MNMVTRKILDRSFSGVSVLSIVLLVGALFVLLGPIFWRGTGAFVFRATVEHRRAMHELFELGDAEDVEAEWAEIIEARRPVYAALNAYRSEMRDMPRMEYYEASDRFSRVEDALRALLGPLPGDDEPALPRDQYGQTRWDRALVKLDDVLYRTEWDYSDPTKMGVELRVPRAPEYAGTALEPMFGVLQDSPESLFHPRWTFFWRFLFLTDVDSHFFGGIWPAVLGTLYLTLGAMLIATPMGVVAAIYLTQYAGQNVFVSLLRTCVSTLAGVPSIVFGLFGLTFFINTMHVSEGRSIVAGSLTLALLVLPTVIRASEEALMAVPQTYREASLSLGATKWRTIVAVLLPASMGGILTSIVISMGRAAGETAPIIFTAAVSLGSPVKLTEVFSRSTPALPWNIYNLCTEHMAVDEIRHVQYGMVLTLISLVLCLNLVAIILRARIARKLRG